ncbi:hypothetical protein GS16_02360 [Candidatus Liberibacter solanacearum]|uniref:hypothetical protein n=1 Tax=Candidatus Liberibacter solanacearum TaxID=556287 RepID=UPI000505AA42|nr:hypothetical protein [Candidatus Liberibacter solanacearum]KGB27694.1 hypothetical protein GS16_02360 [Candidatus Liberibacter solanacearum]KJZ81180.1 hypothetical protein KP07_01390 [Candidatus Liberibacter solanacearum]KQC48913.1 hypothetical protein AP064_03780 [Candidatus Liberibacter solanacearum]
MIVLTLLNTICDLVGLSRFETIYENQDENAVLLISLLQQSGEEISLRIDWPELLRTVTINSLPFHLPQDFHRPLPSGAVIMPDHSLARPVIHSVDWEIVKKTSQDPWYWIDNRILHLSPSPPATFRYFSKNWVIGSQQNPKQIITADDDSTIFPRYLLIKDIIWRWRRAQGLSFDDYLREFDSAVIAEKILFLGG